MLDAADGVKLPVLAPMLGEADCSEANSEDGPAVVNGPGASAEYWRMSKAESLNRYSLDGRNPTELKLVLFVAEPEGPSLTILRSRLSVTRSTDPKASFALAALRF